MDKLVGKKIEEHRDNIISDLQKLVAIKSVVSAKEGDKPFGKDVDDAMNFMFDLARRDGFTFENIDNYGGHIDWNHQGDETMGILCHLDVVPVGENWNFDPFGGEIVDGKIYGRGTADDKGPTIASYYAMKILKELDVKLTKNVRMILGLDEETNWYGMEYYLSKVKPADFGITPDGDFPVVNGEKGILNFSFVKKLNKYTADGLTVKKFVGGNAHNMVADWCKVSLYKKDGNYDNIKETINNIDNQGFDVKVKGIGRNLEINVVGISAHGSTPQKGKNAISKMMSILANIDVDWEDLNDFIDFYNNHIGFEFFGNSLNIDLEDEVSGKTIVNVGVIELDGKSIKLKMNVRYPVTKNDTIIYENISKVIENYDIGIIKEGHKKPIYIPKDSKLIKTLMSVYQENTGDFESEPIIMGGGTYSRAMENFVAYGGIFPGEEELAHQKNEYIKIESLLKMCHIYTNAIYELCK